MQAAFDPLRAIRGCRTPSWSDHQGLPFPSSREGCTDQLSRLRFSPWDETYSINRVRCRDPDNFIAGQLHHHWHNWEFLLDLQPGHKAQEVAAWLRHGVDIHDYFTHFKGSFKGNYYDCRIPPPTVLTNYISGKTHAREIGQHLEERLRNGSLELLGRVGQVPPPRIVMPLVMVTGTRKNRLCHDERFLNLFMAKKQFKLDTLPLIPATLPHGAFMTNCDEKSAYDGVSLSPNSREFFGVQFGGWFMRYTTLPFGWSLSPYIYQTIGMVVTNHLRRQGIVTLQYLDDRFIGPMLGGSHPILEPREATTRATFCTVATLSALGYTLALQKSVLQPTQTLRFLGFDVHADSRQFSIPEEKKLAFKVLREDILRQKTVHLKSLQRLMGKCVSFSLCVPSTKLYIRAMAAASARAARFSHTINLDKELRDEIEEWRFLDTRDQWLPWRLEKHAELTLATDSSTFAWGATMQEVTISDMWPAHDSRPIHLKEAHALLLTLQAVATKLTDRRVEARVDNMAVVHAWTNEGAKDPRLNDILKQIARLVTQENCDLTISYIPSKDNPADAPSRRLSAADTTLSAIMWRTLECSYGPHSFDLMALDSNAQQDRGGVALPHFTPYPLPGSAGTNLFSQSLQAGHNYYCFPPFCLVGPTIKFLMEERARPLRVSLVVPHDSPAPPWWPLLQSVATLTPLASQGDRHAILIPSKAGYRPRPLHQDLYVARMELNAGH